MQYIYNIHGIGIYIQQSDEVWNRTILAKLASQLAGFEDTNNNQICQKIIIRNYTELCIDDLNGALLTSESCLYFKDLFVDQRAKTAFKVSSNVLEFWVDKGAWFSVPYLLQILFIQRELAFIHAAAISVDGIGILLPAFGGTGKTAFISEVAKANSVKILGDDLILMDQKSFLYSYYRPFCLYSYHEDLFPEFFHLHKVVYREPTFLNRVIRKSKRYLRLKDYSVYGYISVSPLKLFNKSKIEYSKVPLKFVFILRRIRGLSEPRVNNKITPEFTANFCMSVFVQEFGGLQKAMSNFLISENRLFFSLYERTFDIYYQSFRGKVIKVIDIPEKTAVKKTALLVKDIVLQLVD